MRYDSKQIRFKDSSKANSINCLVHSFEGTAKRKLDQSNPPIARNSIKVSKNFVIIPSHHRPTHKFHVHPQQKFKIHCESNTRKAKKKLSTLESTQIISLDSVATAKKAGITVTKYAYYSKVGVGTEKNKKNQDSFFVHTRLMNNPRQHLFGVADGHGEFGREVSGLIKQTFPRTSALTLDLFTSSLATMDVPNALRIAYYQTNNKLRESSFNVYTSGSTCVCLVVSNEKLYSGNVGDSRAVICSVGSDGKVIGKPLTRDHKPNDPAEAKRIIESGGRIAMSKGNKGLRRVDSAGNSVGPLRVWKKTENTPGLAMTRAIGDLAASEVGIIPDPEIFVTDLNVNDKFAIIGSDGVWESLTNQEAVELVWPFYRRNKAEEGGGAVVKEAHKRWTSSGGSIDDITCIVVFFGYVPNHCLSQSSSPVSYTHLTLPTICSV
eukprot:TRINITY_DN11849_c0_g1_i1.p1 TRINITY_DN11849_c0_g1~~TRINITY_DN11849_c0_g1_i1.p1  ORF type:complete len:436 (+),score=51.75 TRINITY_DN11849_c0_g1_i1:438-1745(+)